MNRRFAWLGGLVGAFAVWKWFRKRPTPMGTHGNVDVQDPAAELRAKLAESRTVAAEQHEQAAEPEQTVEDAADPETRRRDVHAAARARLDGLKGSGGDDGADA